MTETGEKFPGEVEWHEQRPAGQSYAQPGPHAQPVPQTHAQPAPQQQTKEGEFQKGRFEIKVCGCCGIPVYIHWLFPLIFVLDIANAFRYPEPFLFLALFMCLDAILYVSVLLHELGHCLAAKLVGGRISHILLWPLGGLAYVSHGGAPKADALIALAGPLTHIPQAIVYGFVLAATPFGFEDLMYYTVPMSDFFAANLIRGCFRMQILLFCFNLFIPAFPLDGGRIFASLLIQCFDLRKTALILICTTIPIGLALLVWGAVKGLSLTFLVALWVLWQAFKLFQARKQNKLEEHSLFLTNRGQQQQQHEAGSGPI